MYMPILTQYKHKHVHNQNCTEMMWSALRCGNVLVSSGIQAKFGHSLMRILLLLIKLLIVELNQRPSGRFQLRVTNFEIQQDPVGLLDMEAFLCLPFCLQGTDSSLHELPESQRAGSHSFQSGKGGDAETREEQPRNNCIALGQVPGSSSRDIFELF